MTKPGVSVITVCLNAKQALQRTGASVRDQTSDSFEWIIIDGGSEDGTVEYLEAIDSPHTHWVSEPDEGIYDAMNKGIRIAKGERIWFLNAGDVFYGNYAIGEVEKVPPDIDICFGEVVVEESFGVSLGLRSEVTPHKIPERLEKDLFRHGMVVSHQAFIVSRKLVPFYNSEEYQLSADLDWMLKILDVPRKSFRLGILACVPRYGATMENWRQSQWERFVILCSHYGVLRSLLDHLYIIIRRMCLIVRSRRLK